MKILLRSGTVLTEPSSSYLMWKNQMQENVLITYSTDSSGLIVFHGRDIAEIRLEADEVAETME